jgi:hypothetical protein
MFDADRGNWTKMALACWEKAADGDVSAQTFMGIQQIYSLPCLDRAKKPEADRGLARRLVAVVGRAVLLKPGASARGDLD